MLFTGFRILYAARYTKKLELRPRQFCKLQSDRIIDTSQIAHSDSYCTGFIHMYKSQDLLPENIFHLHLVLKLIKIVYISFIRHILT